MSAIPQNRRFWDPLGSKSETTCIKKSGPQQKYAQKLTEFAKSPFGDPKMGVHSDSAASGSDPGGLEGALVCSLGVSGLLFGAPGCFQTSKMHPKTPKFTQNCSPN